ncbi:MAG: hypothetical protein GY758_01275, partial [Fuerstiella sp.]|nr:hypothetical protein [Fuerstiella sp.]
MSDDFNAPEAIVVLVDAVRFIDECLRKKKTADEDR